MGGSRMDHGRTSDVHDHANAALSNPILLWRGRKREGVADALCTTEGSQTGRGKLSASVRVQTQNRKVRTETLSELETSCADPVDQHLATPLRRAATSSTAASAASATSAPSATSTASSASTAAAGTSTPATTPTTTPTPSTATTTTSTAPASTSSALAPLAPASAASPARGRRSPDRLETTEVGRSSRSNRGQEGGGGTPLKDG
ncbi:unnamed protein product, partial [Closterium sp. NIES-54]